MVLTLIHRQSDIESLRFENSLTLLNVSNLSNSNDSDIILSWALNDTTMELFLSTKAHRSGSVEEPWKLCIGKYCVESRCTGKPE